MTGHLLRYRVMAYVVGTLLIVLVCVGVPLKYLAADGTGAHDTGEWITTYLGVAHGWLYMAFLVSAVLLARVAQWPLGFSIVTLLLGTVPLLSFYAERRATRYTKEAMRNAASPASVSEPNPSRTPRT